MPQYDVRADLRFDVRGARAQTRSVAREVRDLGNTIRGTRNATRDMFAQMLGVGAAVLGFRALTQTMRGLIGSSVAYTSELETTKIGLQAVIAGVENIPWEEAGRRGEAAFQRVREMAILSPATSREMFDIFQGIVGPIESAGFSMNKVLDITRDTTLAAAALNVDYAQASRDISMMARGTAGMEVKLFSLLRSTGAIKEDAKEWNNMLPAQRVEKLSAALAKFAKSGKAVGSSWAGVTSTFKDLVDNFKASVFTPILRKVGTNLERFNYYVLDHRLQLERFFDSVGKDVGFRLQALFDRGQRGFEWIVANWSTIVQRFDQVVTKTREIAPVIAKAALAWEGVQITRSVVGSGLAAGGMMGELLGGAVGALGSIGVGRTARAAPVIPPPEITRAMQLGGFTEALLAGGGLAAAGGGAGGAAAGGATAGAVALGPALAVLAVGIAAVAGVVLTFKEYWKEFSEIFFRGGSQTLQMVMGLGKALWGALAPILKIIGSLIMATIVPAWIGIRTALQGFILVATLAFEGLSVVTDLLWRAVKPAFDWFFGAMQRMSEILSEVFGSVLSEAERARNARDTAAREAQRGHEITNDLDYSMYHLAGAPKPKGAVDLDAIPKSSLVVNNDFRGSRISVKQEFKGDGDPDRIVMAMVHDLTRQAESRISSGFAGALTR